MDQTSLVIAAVALMGVVAVLGVAVVRAASRRPGDAAAADSAEDRITPATEGMKVCPRCGMGNLWTERTCITCSAPLRG